MERGRSGVRIPGVEVDNLNRRQASNSMAALAISPKPSIIVSSNLDHIVERQRELEFPEMYHRAELVSAEGQSLIWASRWLKRSLAQEMKSWRSVFKKRQRGADYSQNRERD